MNSTIITLLWQNIYSLGTHIPAVNIRADFILFIGLLMQDKLKKKKSSLPKLIVKMLMKPTWRSATTH